MKQQTHQYISCVCCCYTVQQYTVFHKKPSSKSILKEKQKPFNFGTLKFNLLSTSQTRHALSTLKGQGHDHVPNQENIINTHHEFIIFFYCLIWCSIQFLSTSHYLHLASHTNIKYSPLYVILLLAFWHIFHPIQDKAVVPNTGLSDRAQVLQLHKIWSIFFYFWGCHLRKW